MKQDPPKIVSSQNIFGGPTGVFPFGPPKHVRMIRLLFKLRTYLQRTYFVRCPYHTKTRKTHLNVIYVMFKNTAVR